MNKVIQTIQEIHKEKVCLFRIGTFYHCYNRDTYILSYLLGYKIKHLELDDVECGFPINSISKVMARLEQNKISYVIIDRRNNYDEEKVQDYKDLNQYNKYYIKSKHYINYKNRIERINKILLNNIENKNLKDKLERIEAIIYEGRKI